MFPFKLVFQSSAMTVAGISVRNILESLLSLMRFMLGFRGVGFDLNNGSIGLVDTNDVELGKSEEAFQYLRIASYTFTTRVAGDTMETQTGTSAASY